VAGSAQSSNGDVSDSFSWAIAVTRPSAVAPIAMVCSCSSRWPVEWNVCGRVSESRTGRRTWRAARAVRVTCGQTMALEPKEPPTNGAITRTSASDIPSRCATVSWLARTPMVES
jgi:hypothetical protein